MFSESFAGGEHATTKLAAAALARVVWPGATLLDVGAGDGVLARHARALGAEAVAVDRVAAPGVLRAEARDFLPGASFEIVVANLPDETLLALAPLLVDATRRVLIVTGARLWRGRAVARALAELTLEPPSASDGWCCFVGRSRS